ncbi:unnamed protein product [Lupinus luteus]|uniref:J domain-containing protein n=1 Tax=Lupinus luteus TaxID=3873 RepID=A0AAV1X2E2_LUPLU
MQHPSRPEAEHLLGMAEKLLQTRDLNGSREFALLAQESEPLLEGPDQILAIVDVLVASEKRVNNHPDWYALLGVDRRTDDIEAMKRQYRRLALLLHPDKSRFTFADHAFNLVADAWAVLSDPIKKSQFDRELSYFTRVDLSAPAQAQAQTQAPSWVQQDKLPVRRTGPGLGSGSGVRNNVPPQGFDFDPRNNNASASAVRNEVAVEESSRRKSATFWTACPYCYRLYEFPRVYEGCVLLCQNCERSIHGIEVKSLPPLVPGQDAYYCCWGFFPMGFVLGNIDAGEKEKNAVPEPEPVPLQQPAATVLPNWMPAPTAAMPQPTQNGGNNAQGASGTPRVTRAAASTGVQNGAPSRGGTPKKRGRPRKYAP